MLSPAQVIAPGERTGKFRLGLDEPVGHEISAEDFAVALVDELEKPAHRRQRFTLGY
jgi:putative NADH-flavin reductase